MDVTASVITIVSSTHTLAINLIKLIRRIKAQNENVQRLEQKADTLRIIIETVGTAYGPHDKDNSIPLDPPEESIRNTVKNVTSRCGDDLKDFEKELGTLLRQRNNGFLRQSLATWRHTVAAPKFARIEKSIESHELSLQLLVNVLHGLSLDATRTTMVKKFDAVLASNEKMFEVLQLLVSSAQAPNQQENSPDLETQPLRRCDTEITLIDPSNDSEFELRALRANFKSDEDAKILHEQIARIFQAWLTSIAADKTLLAPLDPSAGISHDTRPLDSSYKAAHPADSNNSLRKSKSFSSECSSADPPVCAHHGSPVSPHESINSDASNVSPLTMTCDSNSSSSLPPANILASKLLLEAIRNKDMERVNTIDSELKPELEYHDPENKRRTPLILAVELGHNEMVKLLLSKGAKLETRDDSGMTALMLAASRGKRDILSELLDRGADASATDKNDLTALHLAIQKHSSSIYSLLICNENVDINAVDRYGNTPLHYCAQRGLVDAARPLLDGGARIDARNRADLSAAYYAIQKRYYEIVELLLDRGADFKNQLPEARSSNEIERLLKGRGCERPSSSSSRPERTNSWTSPLKFRRSNGVQ